MFTGIVECTAAIRAHEDADGARTISIERPHGWDLTKGQSIAVAGVCVTVEDFDEDRFSVTLVPETLSKTTFGSAVPSRVNLERAMQPSDRFDGHIVQGHVDVVGSVVATSHEGSAVTITCAYPVQFAGMIVEKGSVTLDGVSLTVAAVDGHTCTVALIPTTLDITTLGSVREGDGINIEFDIVGKYIAKQAAQYTQ